MRTETQNMKNYNVTSMREPLPLPKLSVCMAFCQPPCQGFAFNPANNECQPLAHHVYNEGDADVILPDGLHLYIADPGEGVTCPAQSSLMALPDVESLTYMEPIDLNKRMLTYHILLILFT